METKRLFFALWPDNRQRERLRDIITPMAKSVEGRMVDRRNWHVTLVFVGPFPANRVPYLLGRAAEIEVEPFRLNFDRLEFWPRPKIATLSAATVPPELERLHNQIKAIISDLGLKTEERIYRPHITVVRNARSFTTERLAQRAMTEWSGFELVESVTDARGAIYTVVKQ